MGPTSKEMRGKGKRKGREGEGTKEGKGGKVGGMGS